MNFLEELEKLKVQAKDACAVWSLFPSIKKCSSCKWMSSFWEPAISWLNDLANCLVAQRGRPPLPDGRDGLSRSFVHVATHCSVKLVP